MSTQQEEMSMQRQMLNMMMLNMTQGHNMRGSGVPGSGLGMPGSGIGFGAPAPVFNPSPQFPAREANQPTRLFGNVPPQERRGMQQDGHDTEQDDNPVSRPSPTAQSDQRGSKSDSMGNNKKYL